MQSTGLLATAVANCRGDRSCQHRSLLTVTANRSCCSTRVITLHFYCATHVHSAIYATARCPSVRHKSMFYPNGRFLAQVLRLPYRRAVRAGLYPADGPNVQQLVTDGDDALFARVQTNKHHVLRPTVARQHQPPIWTSQQKT